jgi:hypothetical protein
MLVHQALIEQCGLNVVLESEGIYYDDPMIS